MFLVLLKCALNWGGVKGNVSQSRHIRWVELLTHSFIDVLRQLFPHKRIEIILKKRRFLERIAMIKKIMKSVNNQQCDSVNVVKYLINENSEKLIS